MNKENRRDLVRFIGAAGITAAMVGASIFGRPKDSGPILSLPSLGLTSYVANVGYDYGPFSIMLRLDRNVYGNRLSIGPQMFIKYGKDYRSYERHLFFLQVDNWGKFSIAAY